MIVFGGDAGSLRNEVWTAPLADPGTWTLLVASGPAPPARLTHTAIHDPVRDRMIVFGGESASSRLGDVWALTLSGAPVWIELTPPGLAPPALHSHTAIHDPVRDRMVVFGGSDGTVRHEVWALSLSGSPTWTNLAPSGIGPSGRSGHTAIYDPIRDRMVVFGGFDGTSFRRDVWALPLAGSPAWVELTPAAAGPPARARHTSVHDPARDRMIVFGGVPGTGTAWFQDAWALSLSGTPAWTDLAPGGELPAGRRGHAAIHDPVRDDLVVYGGSYGFGTNDDRIWSLSLSEPAWTSAAPPSPAARTNATAIHDPVRRRMVVFGGYDGAPFGGIAGAPRNDVWALDLSATPFWTELTPPGPAPPARQRHTAIHDPIGDRMVVFGGYGSFARNDVWALPLSGAAAWSDITPATGGPIPREGHTAIYDPVRHRMIVYGGHNDATYQDVWALSLSGTPTWSDITPAGLAPAARWIHTAIYDPTGDRMVVFGGEPGGSDVWALSLSGTPAWTQLAPAGSGGPARRDHGAIHDPIRQRMIVFGGANSSWDLVNDAWALSLAGTPEWSLLAPVGTPPATRKGLAAIYDVDRDRMVVYGGVGPIYLHPDAWSLAWESATGDETVDVPPPMDLAPVRPNPFRRMLAIEFTVSTPTRVTLDIHDVHGRRIKRIAQDRIEPGRHSHAWDGTTDAGLAAPSGMYFVRLVAGGVTRSRRAVLID